MKNTERSNTSRRRIGRSLQAAVMTVLALVASGALARDPGVNQPGAVGNVGVGAPGRGVAPGVGVGAPGVGVVDPGLNQPGVAGNVGGTARRTTRR